MVLASHTVQVTIEAKARPINTAFTTGSALTYMPHGLRSRGRVAVATTLSCASAGKGTTSNVIIATSRSIATLDRHTLRKTRSGLLCVRQSSISTGLIHNISGLLWHGKSSWCRHCFGLQIAVVEAQTRGSYPAYSHNPKVGFGSFLPRRTPIISRDA